MAENHTQGPLKTFCIYAVPELHDQDDNFVAAVRDGGPRAVADARRLKACWNACDGVPTEVLERGLVSEVLWQELTAQRDALEDQRNDLIGVLRELHAAVWACRYEDPAHDRVHNAIRDAGKVLAEYQPPAGAGPADAP